MKNVTILNDLNTLNKLHASSVESYTTNNGIVDFTCDNAGYVDNVVIEGETLVNLCYFPNRPDATTYSWYQRFDNRITGHDTYTVIIPKVAGNIGFEVYNTEDVGTKYNFDIDYNVGFRVVNIPKDHRIATIYASKDRFTEDEFKEAVKKTIIIAGDHTDKPISYFEGLKSAGQGDKIEVLARNQSNKNLFYGDVELGYIDNKTGINGDSVNGVRSVEYIKVDKNTTYTISDDKGYNVSVNLYGENKSEYFGEIYGKTPYTFTTDDKTYWIRLRTFTGSKQNDTTIKWQLEKGNKSTEYAQPKYDKKEISTTLRSLPNGVKDTIEKRGNKYVKVQRCEEIVIDNNLEPTGTGVVNQVLTRGQNYVLPNLKRDANSPLYCNCLKVEHRDNEVLDEEHIINLGDGRFRVRVLKSKLSSDSLEGSIAYWNSIKPTIVYELETPIVTELPNFNLQTYKGDNTLLINSGVIQCDASFDVCEGIRSELDEVKDKVSSIYDTVVEGIRETRHYPKLQNGWVTNSHDYTPTFVKFGNLVTFNMRIKGGKWSSATIIVDNLPEEFRVKAGHAQVFPAIDLANDKTYNAIMYKEGHIKLYGVDAEPTGGLAIMGTYYVN